MKLTGDPVKNLKKMQLSIIATEGKLAMLLSQRRELIENYRAAGWSMAGLAEMLGVSRQRLYQILSEKSA